VSGFGADSLERQDYDFRTFPRDDGEPGKCTGVGYIPEPTEARLRAFMALQQEMRDKLERPDTESVNDFAFLEDIRLALIPYCAGYPAEAEIRQLPPRVLIGFMRYAVECLAPKG